MCRAASLILLALVLGCSPGPLSPATRTEDQSAGTFVPSPGVPASASATPSSRTAGTTAAPEESSPVRSSAPPDAPFGLPDSPPPVTVRTNDKSVQIRPYTYCYGNGCVDGVQPSHPPDFAEAPHVEVEFPLDGWSFEASFVPVGVACPRTQSVPVAKTGDHTYVVRPAGPADTYDVTLVGQGDGDLFVTFRWTTPQDGPMPVPDARLAVLADHDGEVDSYGVELELSDLRATPKSARAEITVTAANGKSLSFEAIPAKGCLGEGAIYWNGPDRAGRQAARLGPAPFRYGVVVVLDGVRYAASAAWPADEIDGNEPSAELIFAPSLPALP